MKQDLHVPYPDREIFLYDDKYTSTVKEQDTTFMLDHVEYVPFKGVLIYIKGATYPKKGFPTPESVWAINQAKVVLREAVALFTTRTFLIGFILTWNKKAFIERMIQSYTTIAMRSMKPYLLKGTYLCLTASAVGNTVIIFLTKLGFDQQVASELSLIVSHIFEYDDAYRYRLQDMATEMSVDILSTHRDFEIRYLMNLYREREGNAVVVKKVERVATLLRWALRLKGVQEALQEAVKFTVPSMRYDDADWYWVSMRGDYLFGGKTYEERYAALAVKPNQYEVIHE